MSETERAARNIDEMSADVARAMLADVYAAIDAATSHADAAARAAAIEPEMLELE